ncbi:hypothetical protein [Kitasatospora sp. NBC_00458]|uniref:hypothetical protein n=1 Tax=Kitasatospora sp. NBC_00458 TaxID=2903568 RepID=UPI002E19023D
MADRKSGAQVWGAVVVMTSALAVVAAYLIDGAALVLVVAGVEVLLLMVYVGWRWQLLHQVPRRERRQPARGHRPAGGVPDAAHCERCRRAREAIDARQAERLRRSLPVQGRESAAPARPAREHRSYDRSAGHHRQAHGQSHGQAHGHPAPYDAHGHGRPSAQDPHGGHESRGGREPHGGHDSRAGHESAPPHDRPAREWTAERAAARSGDRPTARHGAPGSAGRAVGHQ